MALLASGCTAIRADPATGASARAQRPLLLIHGAWHGGWCWDPLIAELRHSDPDRVIHAPSLLGMADRADTLTPTLGLDDQITDMERYIEREDLHDLVLVGHSFGGMILTGLADRLGERIAHLVYLDAPVPRNGESMATSGRLPLTEAERAAIHQTFMGLATDGIAMTPLPPAAFGVPEDHPLHDWVARNLSPHPVKTCLDPIRLTGTAIDGLARTYIACTQPRLEQPGVLAGAHRARDGEGWQYRELATGHDAMITAPVELAALLNSLA